MRKLAMVLALGLVACAGEEDVAPRGDTFLDVRANTLLFTYQLRP